MVDFWQYKEAEMKKLMMGLATALFVTIAVFLWVAWLPAAMAVFLFGWTIAKWLAVVSFMFSVGSLVGYFIGKGPKRPIDAGEALRRHMSGGMN